MNRLQLATLLSWAGNDGLKGRKRLQKVVFFLQEAGCPLDCRYTLHHFGPYSRDVADACDEMVAAGLIQESGGPQNGDMQYTYKLTQSTAQYLAQAVDQKMRKYESIGKDLIKKDIRILELGSTILLFYGQNRNWGDALNQACKFKNMSADAQISQDSLEFAQWVVGADQ